MSFEDVLKDYKPVENEDESGFDILKGTYKTVVTKLLLGATKDLRPRYELELTVNEIIEGNGNSGRKLWRNYLKDDEKAQKKFLNDLHTAGIELPKSSLAEFESSFYLTLNKEVVVRAWGWTPDKKMDGSPIPPEEQVPVQQFKIINQTKVKTRKKTTDLPF